jgi:hypothetical protein
MLKSNCIPKYFNLETVKLILVSTQLSSSDKESNRATCFDLKFDHLQALNVGKYITGDSSFS